ncbi:hypothetical protein H6501_03290 [Candidatus Woesearchaeota archaeon]|nr:hypothetical protein [Nanoarchaeota archaeon]MCB9370593.1 hypothetical protein [Candidatus Woesearchaeota archaeon]USN43674.1 MAG: hypothetical protein H6500_04775 [Candidatus Woesearchaeota archaeon]
MSIEKFLQTQDPKLLPVHARDFFQTFQLPISPENIVAICSDRGSLILEVRPHSPVFSPERCYPRKGRQNPLEVGKIIRLRGDSGINYALSNINSTLQLYFEQGEKIGTFTNNRYEHPFLLITTEIGIQSIDPCLLFDLSSYKVQSKTPQRLCA